MSSFIRTTPSHTIPKVVLNTVLKTGKLNICHGNVQSLCAHHSSKFEEVRLLLEMSKVTVACFTETWLNEAIPDGAIGILGYKVIRNDRVYKRGGGIAVYIKEHVRHRTVYCTSLCDDSTFKTECLGVEISIGAIKLASSTRSLQPT